MAVGGSVVTSDPVPVESVADTLSVEVEDVIASEEAVTSSSIPVVKSVKDSCVLDDTIVIS